jgi:acetyl esterase/lipase
MPSPCDRTAGHRRPSLGPAWLRVPDGCPPGRSPSSAADPDLAAQNQRDSVSAYAAPARAADLSGLPAAYLELGSADTLCDEGLDYAKRIWAAGRIAELHVWPGGFHAFDLIAAGAALATDAAKVRLAWLNRILRG